jgi:hypothetical protein
VDGCARCLRTLGAGSGVIASPVVVVVGVVVLGVVVVEVGVLVVDGVVCDGGGAGTVVVSEEGAAVSCAGTVGDTSASAAHARTSPVSAARTVSIVVVWSLRVISLPVNRRAGS